MLRLTWSLTRAGDALHLDYTVSNDGPNALIVVDKIIWNTIDGYVADPDLVVVRDDPEAATVAFMRGWVQGITKTYLMPPRPSVVQLAPGTEMVREARVSLPLVALHNVDTSSRPLRAGNTHAVLEVGWIDDPKAVVERHFIGRNTTVDSTSHWVSQRWLRGERLPLPHLS